jgi:hypothetical protein
MIAPRIQTRRFLIVLIAAACALVASLLNAPPSSANLPAPDGGSCGIRSCVVQWAQNEFLDRDGHKLENPMGTDCNYFTSVYNGIASNSGCNNGYWHEAWCMDFAHWVYAHAGAKTGPLTHMASSAKDYGIHFGTWHTSGPRPGDLALWKSSIHSHVGIVISVPSSTSVVIISGNWSNQVSQDTFAMSNFEGFASPVLA